MPAPRVYAFTATFRRPAGLMDLLASLRSEQADLAGVIVVDNAAASETAEVVAKAALTVPVRIVTPARNLGCGGGVALGLQEAFRDPTATHAWMFDDDAQAVPGALRAMLAGLEEASADAVMPLVDDASGRLGWFPGPLTEPAWGYVRSARPTIEGFRARCGMSLLRWTWAAWPSLVVSRRAVETVGVPRDDYWFQGEDIEWTLRVSASFRCVLAPAAASRHFPPPIDALGARLKGAAALQNNLYTMTRLPHGRRIARHLPGNLVRFLRGQRYAREAWVLALRAHWLGAVRGLPAGAPGGDYFQRRWLERRTAAAPATR